MAQAYRYPLTRVCLKSGTMTLPLAMLQLFPEQGPIVAVDNETGAEYELELTAPRVLAGLGDLFGAHQLEVNDELHVTPLGDNRFGFDVITKAKRAADSRPAAVAAMLDEFASAGVAATEAEVHVLFPTLAAGLDVAEYLEADPRFEFRNGRWQSARKGDDAAPEAAAEEPAASTPARIAAESVDQVAELVETAAGVPRGGQAAEAEAHAQESAGRGGEQPPLWSGNRGTGIWQDFAASAGKEAAQDRPAQGGHVHERRVPAPQPRPDRGADNEGSDLRVVDLAQRLRRVLEPLGFRLEPLGGGQMTIVADMGRRKYQVHAQLLPAGERLDWAALLAKRRGSSARYLAVIGDHHDLLRLTSPAELARATLWSWAALDRLRVLHGTVPLSPIDLESYFEHDGLFEVGLERFENSVSERVAERGATSRVLTRLANLRAPTVFLLEELAADADMSREGVLRILERLAEAPFHLVARVDQGEFLLRMRVADALGNLSAYAESLRQHLPNRKHERLTGLDDEVDVTPDVAAKDPDQDVADGGVDESIEA